IASERQALRALAHVVAGRMGLALEASSRALAEARRGSLGADHPAVLQAGLARALAFGVRATGDDAVPVLETLRAHAAASGWRVGEVHAGLELARVRFAGGAVERAFADIQELRAEVHQQQLGSLAESVDHAE